MLQYEKYPQKRKVLQVEGKLLILGAGGFGRTVADAMGPQFDAVAFLDDAPGPGVLGPCGDYLRYAGAYAYAYPAFGNNDLRGAWLNRLEAAGYRLPRLVHPQAFVSASALVEPGAVVLPMACVGAGSLVRRGAIVNFAAVLDHDCALGFCAHLAPGAIVKAGNRVAAMAKIESGTVLMRPGQ